MNPAGERGKGPERSKTRVIYIGSLLQGFRKEIEWLPEKRATYPPLGYRSHGPLTFETSTHRPALVFSLLRAKNSPLRGIGFISVTIRMRAQVSWK